MKTTKKKSQIEIKVLAVNTLRRWSKNILHYEIPKLKALEGIECFKIDWSFKSKYAYDKHPEINGQMPDGTWYNVTYWHEHSGNEYGIRVKLCLNGGSYDDRTYFCIYDEQSFFPFVIKEGKLISKPDYSYTWINKMFKVSDLEKAAAKVHALAERYERECDKVHYEFHSVLNIQRLTRA